MSAHLAEEEQIEAIKKWWQRWSTPVLVGISCVMLLIAGVRYYNWHHQKIMTNASATYERMMLAFSNQNTVDVSAYAENLVQNYPQLVYADVARLLLARQNIEANQLEQAGNVFQDLIAHAKNPMLRQIARTRLARLQINAKQYQKALATLSIQDDTAFEPLVVELQGDIYALMGSRPKAVAAYRKALTLTADLDAPNVFLEMKLNDLSMLRAPVTQKQLA